LRCGATGSAADSKGAFLSRPLAIDFRPEDEHPRLTMLVTRAEEWCVEAETAEEAREAVEKEGLEYRYLLTKDDLGLA